MRWANPEQQLHMFCISVAISLKYYFCNFSQTPSSTLGFLCSEFEPSAGFNIQLAKLQVHNETISTQPIRHEEAPVLHHLQPKPPLESAKPEQSCKPNHTLVCGSISVLRPPRLWAESRTSRYAPALCSVFPVCAKPSDWRVPDKFRKPGDESNQREE